MADVIPLELDTTTNPGTPVLKRLPLANKVKPDRLPAATALVQGAAQLSSANPSPLGTAAPGASVVVAREDHVHAHGNLAGGALHAAADASTPGFMAAADKAALDALPAAIASEATTRGNADTALAASITALNPKLVPAGGTTGQALKKASNADHALVWADDQTGGGGNPLEDDNPQPLGTAAPGSAIEVSRGDHVHAHGNLAGGALHADVVAAGASGFMTGAQATQLAGTPAAIAAAVATETTNRIADVDAEEAARISGDGTLATAITNEAITRAAADTANATAISTETTNRIADVDAEEAARIAAIAALTASNLTSTGVDLPAEPERGLFRDRTGATFNLYGVCAQLGLEAELVGNSVRVRRRPKIWQPRARSSVESYQRLQHKARRTAGAVGDNAASGPDYLPATLVASHGSSDHLYPRMMYTGVDTHGIVHKFHAGLRGNYAATSAVKGYEFGEPVSAGDAREGQRFLWTIGGGAENVTWDDAFWDFAIEINPTSGDFAGDNLMRMVGPELGAHWAGEIDWEATIELKVTGPDSCKVRGEWTLYSSTGAVLKEWRRRAELVGEHDWLTQDARLQLSWRVDRDLATRKDVFNGLNQGERQGANVLRCHVDRYEYEPIGFREE